MSSVAQRGTMRALAISTRGASGWVGKMPTGFPDWIKRVSSRPKVRRAETIRSKAPQFRAAFPRPPYTMRWSGSRATSGSRLFMRRRRAASWGQP